MNPDDQKQTPSRNLDVPARDAAANIIRGQLDELYSDTPAPVEKSSAQPAAPTTPAAQPKAVDAETSTPQAAGTQHWERYHNAWQEYYQEYYNRYYTNHVHQVLKEHQPAPATPPADAETVSGLQRQIADRVRTSAVKARKSRHFIPITAAVFVMLLFGFLQYNSILIGTVQAYVSPGAINPQNIIVDPTSDAKVSSDPKLIIPKLNVDVPVVYNVALTHDAQMAAMQQGVAHFAVPGADSVPGQVGNTVLSGHSSNDLFEPGDYKFIFAQLDKLQTGDTIYVNYQGTRYAYAVTKKEVVSPTNVQALIYPTDKPILTLITCTPLGTSLNRLLVTAEQIAPDPAKAAPASSDSGSSSGAAMPGNSPTVLEKMFGSKG